MEKEVIEASKPLQFAQVGCHGQTVRPRASSSIDLLDEQELRHQGIRPIMARLGYRSLLAVPLLREERIMGALTVWRKR